MQRSNAKYKEKGFPNWAVKNINSSATQSAFCKGILLYKDQSVCHVCHVPFCLLDVMVGRV